MGSQPALRALVEAFDRHVRPGTFPLAVRMLRPGEAVPDKARAPRRDLGFQTAICQAFGLARRYGWTLAVGKDDLSCPLGATAFGFAPLVDYYAEGHACAGFYTATAEAGARSEAAVPKFPHGAYERIVVGPAARATFDPDLVMVYASSAQVLRLVTAALYDRGGALTTQISGRIDCADLVIRTMQTGECQVVLPCYGDRIFAQTQDHEMAFTVPAGRFEAVVQGLDGTAKGGIRYPIPSFLRYTGEFPPAYTKVREFWPNE
ncbi:MAG TPA: DUF169 domain-containing protein [Thermodesulfobacteriota bacterium]